MVFNFSHSNMDISRNNMLLLKAFEYIKIEENLLELDYLKL
jgi:hypothetical protein